MPSIITRQEQLASVRSTQLSNILKQINNDFTNGLPAVAAVPETTLPNGQVRAAVDAQAAVSPADVQAGYPADTLSKIKQILVIANG